MAKKKKTTVKKIKTPRFEGTQSFLKNRQTQTVFGFFLVIFSIFLLAAFVSFLFSWKVDQSELSEFANRSSSVKNLLGKIGHSLSNIFIYKGFGVSAFSIPILLFTSGMYILFQVPLKKMRKPWFWGLLGMLWFSILFGFFAINNSLLSGVVGFEINDYLQKFLGRTGIALLLLFSLFTYLAIRFKLNAHHISSLFKKKEKEISNDSISDIIEDKITQETNDVELNTTIETKSEFEMSVEDLKPTISNYMGKKDKKSKEKEDVTLDIELKKPEETEVEIAIEKIVEEKTVEENLSDKLVKDFGEFDPTLDLGNYKFPTLNLLREFNESISINQEELEVNKNRIVETLNNYKIGISKIKATVGPTVTLYEIVPEAGVRISKIKNLEDDIALSLAALGIRIIAPIPGRGTIGIEVPNKNATMVSMKSMISSSKFQKSEMELPISFGKTISNESLAS